ncbi:MAG TPA: hypothetical protein VL921_15105 [Candidatus Udaeobacter sp.]|nr:hypothetical protein [Candidatus Udaeobacter sp.]
MRHRNKRYLTIYTRPPEATSNKKPSVYIRVIASERVLVVHNLSGEQQVSDLQPSKTYGVFQELIHATSGGAKLDGSKQADTAGVQHGYYEIESVEGIAQRVRFPLFVMRGRSYPITYG